jgi:hypothetical protein
MITPRRGCTGEGTAADAGHIDALDRPKPSPCELAPAATLKV